MQWKDVSEKLKLIPHLKLDVEVPLDEILQELTDVVQNDFELITLNLEIRNQEGQVRPWYGRGLIDYLPDSRRLYEYKALKPDWIKRDQWGDVILSSTELAPLMPKTMKLVHSIIERPRVTRLLKLPPGAVLPWHSHCQNPVIGFTDYRKMVVQVPLITNPNVFYRVRAVGEKNKSEDKVYKVAETMILNAWDEHQVENRGDEDRVALYIEAPLTDERFMAHVLKALKTLS